MTAFSLRLPENLMKEVEAKAKALHVPRSEYVRLAISRMNRDVAVEERRKRLQSVSERVREESMRICAEFDAVEYGRGKAG
ncbi:MAG: ribbon-helix-helix protein, CopG family [Rhodocyclaceae bacterium]|nr:ribbon-helix-helix protein, CopG family [Rhodocyclaceae bacterium]